MPKQSADCLRNVFCRLLPIRGVEDIKFSVGSEWVPVPAEGQQVFEVIDSATQTQLATVTAAPPRSPGAATLYLYGVALTGTSAKLLSDAPELDGMGHV